MKELKHLGKWILIIIPLSGLIGSIIALFLWLLKWATQTRISHPWFLFLLPLAGLLIIWSYIKIGKNSEKGNNLIIDEIHKPGGGIPKRMTPLVFIGTIITHLFGGSAGREGTAVQIGGSVSAWWGNILKLNERDTRVLLIAGVAAGFGAVFGTPLTGAFFALEVLVIGRMNYEAIIPALLASVLADLACSAWGLGHTRYTILFSQHITIFDNHIKFDPILMGKIIIACIAFGLAAFLFSELIQQIKTFFAKNIKNPYLVPIIGGLMVIGITFIYGNTDYNGLGVYASRENGVSILSAFHKGGANPFSWLQKLILTAVTLGSGFKGGEVTPLFYIGATLGNALGELMNAPIDLFAGIGFIAVFAAATNTPLACTIMGIELFGSENAIYFAVACFIAYYFSGQSGIYSSQRIGVPKLFDHNNNSDETLGNLWNKKKNKT